MKNLELNTKANSYTFLSLVVNMVLFGFIEGFLIFSYVNDLKINLIFLSKL